MALSQLSGGCWRLAWLEAVSCGWVRASLVALWRLVWCLSGACVAAGCRLSGACLAAVWRLAGRLAGGAVLRLSNGLPGD